MKVELGILTRWHSIRRFVCKCKAEQHGDTLRIRFPENVKHDLTLKEGESLTIRTLPDKPLCMKCGEPRELSTNGLCTECWENEIILG